MYLKWWQNQLKIRRKSSSTYSHCAGGEKGYMPVNNNEDADTITSLMEDNTPLVDGNQQGRRVSRKKLIQILNKRFQKASNILQIQTNKKENRNRLSRTNSIPLPCEPFKQVCNREINTPEKVQHFGFITANEVKKALARKTKRYLKGTYCNGIVLSSAPPPPKSSPVRSFCVEQKRYSRSFSDLLSIIELTENKTEKLLIRRGSSTDTNTYNNNNNNIDSSNKTELTTTTASIETIVQKQKGKEILILLNVISNNNNNNNNVIT